MTLYKFSVGAVLAVAMVGVLGVSALVFSSRDFQFGVAQVAPTTNGRVDFAELDRVDAQIASIRDESQPTRDQLNQVQEQLAALERAEAAANQSRAEIVGDVARIEQHAELTSEVGDMSAQGLSQRINTLAARPNLSAEDQQRVATLAADVTQLADQENVVAASTAERASLTEQRRLIGDQVAQSDGQIHTLQARVVPEYQHYDRIRNEARSLQSLSVFGISAHLAQGHPSLLSTILVLLMGALGSLLYLFPAYLNRAEPVTMAEIFVRLIFGMCAALALYILANALAGFSIGSTSRLSTTAATLNPFTVALVGIVAGVLSEDIAKWIQDRGRGIFSGQGVSAPAPAREPAPSGGMVNNEALNA